MFRRDVMVLDLLVASNTILTCTFGTAPAKLNVFPDARIIYKGQPLATVMDNRPIQNIIPFGMCTSMANPAVAAATAAALGVLTPMPCMPMPCGPWSISKPSVLLAGKPCLTSSSKLMCAYGGQISITPQASNITTK